MRGERYGGPDRRRPYDRGNDRGRYGGQDDRYDQRDRYDRGGRDRPGSDREDRGRSRGRERPGGDRPSRDYADRAPAGRGPSAGRVSADRAPAGRGPAGRDYPGRSPASRPNAGRPPAGRPPAGRPPAGRDYESRRDVEAGDRKDRSGRVRGITALLAVAATASLAVAGYACSLAVLNRAHLGRGAHSGTSAGSYVVTGISSFVSSNAMVAALGSAKPAQSATTPAAPPPVSLTLTARDKRECPAAATACVDIAEHITWLQSNGKVTYGPVQMEPGPPGTVHATPTGTFNVAWKAGPTYMSTIYHELIPWAVFFAPGGIAFHEGSLTVGSHGCVHLTMDAAHYYNENLPIGAEVVVF
jgi:hypothetical protein